MVVSLDPVGHTIAMLSLPRDLIDVPLGNGDVYAPKLNSLMSYADSHPEEFPGAGWPPSGAVRSLLGIDIQYHAQLQFGSFIRMVDAVGGVDVDVVQGFGPDMTATASRTRLVDHGRSPSPGWAQRPRVLPVAQGGRRERLHAELRQQRGHRGAAGCRDEGRQPAVEPRR